MERFGANTGDPFTTKQIQHISIAVSRESRVAILVCSPEAALGHVLVCWSRRYGYRV